MLYVYDDEPTEFPELTAAQSCEKKVSFAQTNHINITFDANGEWVADKIEHGYGFFEHNSRWWWMVLANCEGFQDIHFEVRLEGSMLYDAGTGPNTCSAPVTNTEYGLVVGVVMCGILVVVLGGTYFKQWKQARELQNKLNRVG